MKQNQRLTCQRTIWVLSLACLVSNLHTTDILINPSLLQNKLISKDLSFLDLLKISPKTSEWRFDWFPRSHEHSCFSFYLVKSWQKILFPRHFLWALSLWLFNTQIKKRCSFTNFCNAIFSKEDERRAAGRGLVMLEIL